MATASRPLPQPQTEMTVADLYRRFGPIPYSRIRQIPAPGTATVADVVEIQDREDRLYELIDGILVEKDMGLQESMLAMLIGRLLGNFVDARKLGVVTGPDGTMSLAPGLIRIPDVAFSAWERFPNRRMIRTPIPNLVPDLAVEVLSQGNTRKEMDEKLDDYFAAGVRLVWFVDPARRSVRVYTSRQESRLLRESHTLDGGEVLPGLEIPVRVIFEDVPVEPKDTIQAKPKRGRSSGSA